MYKLFSVWIKGPSAANCVEALRQEGFTGRIVMVCKEPYNPYDRIKVSKVLDSTPEKIQLRSNEFYAVSIVS